MLHRIITRLASALLIAALLAIPASADAQTHRHHKRHARHHVVKHKAVSKSTGRSDRLGQEPSEPSSDEPAGDAPSGDSGAGEPDPADTPSEPDPTPPVVEQPADAGVVADFGEGVLDIELNSGGHVVGRLIQGGTQFSCRSASTHETVTEGCNASLLTDGRSVHEFSVNYGPNGAWFQRIIIVLA
jgi:hypothetical protein